MTLFNFKMLVHLSGYTEYHVQTEAESIEEAVSKATTILKKQAEYKTEGFEVIDTVDHLYQTNQEPRFLGEVV